MTDEVPRWERLYRGRFQWEFDALREKAREVTVDPVALAGGTLDLRLEWPLRGQFVELRAIYPDAFPNLQPLVFLIDRQKFPARHCSPIDGRLCLLGRDTAQWTPRLTLRELLDEKLEDAMYGTGEEDPQAEPAEFWWNCLGTEGSYCLVDSRWDFGQATHGTLRLRYRIDHAQPPVIRAAVTEVRDSNKTTIGRCETAFPHELAASTCPATTIPWLRVNRVLLPTGNAQQVVDLRNNSDYLQRQHPQQFHHNLYAHWFALVFDSEVAPGVTSPGYAFIFAYGSKRSFRHGAQANLKTTLIRTYRAGPTDIGARVPAVGFLRKKKIAVVGLGTIGAPIAIELARNGCGRLHVVEHDIVEPGNSIRWPLGAEVWGRKKVLAIRDFVARDYPWSEVVAHDHAIGNFSAGLAEPHGDDAVIGAIIADVDLMIDATASYGVTTLLGERCRRANVPLISVYASPTVEGGVVARFSGTDGCPVCLEHGWHAGSIRKPPGLGTETHLQPAGCSERTFAGANFDLQELSLQAVRLAVESLSEKGVALGSVIHRLSYLNDAGGRALPRWDAEPIAVHHDCTCQQGQ